mgnify:CR=1 FL=1
MLAPDPGKVLVVDDDAPIRALVSNALKKAGFAVTTVNDGREALDAAKASAPDLILSDWMMPHLDGVGLCKAVKGDPALAGIFFILLTAKTTVQDKVLGLETGADDYLTKPFQAQELVAKARASLRIKRLQDALAERNRALQELNAMKDEFLGMAAHDMRNPLGVVRLWGESMADGLMGPVSPEQAKALEVIQRNVDGMLRLINDLLDISKIESGKVELRLAPLDLAQALASYVEGNALLAGKKGIALASEVPPGLPAVKADKDKLGEILNNLISNALKFTKPGGSVLIRATQEGAFVRLEVRDTGQGIAPEDLPRLFRKFSQTRTRSTAGEKGTGLGLAIVKKLVELHGGEVGVESVHGKGSTFRFTLPLA